MIAPDSHWMQPPSAERYLLREQRSGMSGLGGRPVLHPAWSDPIESDGASRTQAAPTRVRPQLTVYRNDCLKAA